MKKNVTALALALAGMTAQDAFATVSTSAVVYGSQIQIGCTAPSPTGATVYSIDNAAINSANQADVIALPSGVSAGASCSYAINQFNAQTGVGASTGKWVGAQNSNSTNTGVSPVNVTIPGSGYSLQAFTFVAQ